MTTTLRPIFLREADGTLSPLYAYAHHVDAAAKLAAGFAAERRHNRYGATEQAEGFVIQTRNVAEAAR